MFAENKKMNRIYGTVCMLGVLMKVTQTEISLIPPAQGDFEGYRAAVAGEQRRWKEIQPLSQMETFYFEPSQGRQASHQEAVKLCHKGGGSIVDWSQNKELWRKWWKALGEDDDPFWAQSSGDQCSIKTKEPDTKEAQCDARAHVICQITKENPGDLKYAVQNLAAEWNNILKMELLHLNMMEQVATGFEEKRFHYVNKQEMKTIEDLKRADDIIKFPTGLVAQAIFLLRNIMEEIFTYLSFQIISLQGQVKHKFQVGSDRLQIVERALSSRAHSGPGSSMGQKGEAGPRGNPGIDGTVGMPGPKGIPGRDGLPGLGGQDGDMGSGVQGDKGSQGLPGKKGPKGSLGEQGVPGIQGIQGVPGSDGRQGPEGPPGQDFASTFKEPPDQRGGNDDVLRGSTGLKGKMGPSGQTGSPGTTGPKGQTGSPGTTGPKGQIGPTGSTGTTGPKGEPGGPGTLQSKGETGSPGTTGSKGQIGPTGSPGTTGPKGEPGGPGSTGITEKPINWKEYLKESLKISLEEKLEEIREEAGILIMKLMRRMDSETETDEPILKKMKEWLSKIVKELVENMEATSDFDLLTKMKMWLSSFSEPEEEGDESFIMKKWFHYVLIGIFLFMLLILGCILLVLTAYHYCIARKRFEVKGGGNSKWELEKNKAKQKVETESNQKKREQRRKKELTNIQEGRVIEVH